MERFITNPQEYTLSDLRNYDWDIIKLNITFDVEPMLKWFNEMQVNQLADYWAFSMKHTFNPSLLDNPRMDGISVGDSGFWSLQWPIQRSGPIPNHVFCNSNIYPEIDDPSWISKMSNHLDQYYHGAYRSFVEQLGQDTWSWGRAMAAGTEVGIGPHKDHDDAGYLIRLHVNIQTDEKSTWHFGTQLGETPILTWPYMNREYHPNAGDIYLVNVSNVHSPVNHGLDDWLLLHSNPADSCIDRLLKSTQHISLG